MTTKGMRAEWDFVDEFWSFNDTGWFYRYFHEDEEGKKGEKGKHFHEEGKYNYQIVSIFHFFQSKLIQIYFWFNWI